MYFWRYSSKRRTPCWS
uniref:Putative photosystem I reaction centre subunit IV n=1 Tax=Rhizophora mucronata TaxID=61149 RepID=A0A2P2K8J0_RHIMU